MSKRDNEFKTWFYVLDFISDIGILFALFALWVVVITAIVL